MDNPAFLYLTGVGGQAPMLIAQARGKLPLLWQILLAGGAPAAGSDPASPVIDAVAAPAPIAATHGNDAPRLTSNADAALLRLRCVVDFIASHPALRTRPSLGWAFDGALASLREAVAAQPGRSFSVGLEALSWISDATPATFIEECRADCNARWRMLAEAISARDHMALSRALYLDDPDDWRYWADSFGFSTLADPYFHGHITQPDAPHPLAPLPRRSSWWRWFNAD
ncbi:hypothetical protein FXN63_01625 [Pigmentiphaga aceris]|uniref:Uncharacterized protein n=1 Tax=Pigmentiphaga aceris TaxID=1940612 RepID=A0A5C0ATS2_9BURK|nr:hypothetical protein [Pigmentiphaga aceris]QEI04683.1 hypothetical protein FXN63_01625 [Pigmentiphaga aceris]